jgi:hypothetical protein
MNPAVTGSKQESGMQKLEKMSRHVDLAMG